MSGGQANRSDRCGSFGCPMRRSADGEGVAGHRDDTRLQFRVRRGRVIRVDLVASVAQGEIWRLPRPETCGCGVVSTESTAASRPSRPWKTRGPSFSRAWRRSETNHPCMRVPGRPAGGLVHTQRRCDGGADEAPASCSPVSAHRRRTVSTSEAVDSPRDRMERRREEQRLRGREATRRGVLNRETRRGMA